MAKLLPKALMNLWDFGWFDGPLKSRYGIDRRAHLRVETFRNEKLLVYVVRRRPPNPGFEYGNFPVDKETLEWIVVQDIEGNSSPLIAAYVALVEDYDGGDILGFESAVRLQARLSRIEPYTNREDGSNYWWIDDRFDPVRRGTRTPLRGYSVSDF